MKVKIKKLHPDAKIPTKVHESDFCYDVYAVSRKRIGWRTWEYSIGLAWAIDWPFKPKVKDKFNIIFKNSIKPIWREDLDFNFPKINISIDFRPRSSIYKTGLVLSNCVGTIDELYRGEVKAIFYHVNPFKKKYKVGDRIGQIKLGFTVPIEFKEVDDLDMDTERGTGGFGSTGK